MTNLSVDTLGYFSHISIPQLLFFSGLLGLIIGSFISMLSWRLPRILLLDEESTLKSISVGGSKCPHCSTRLPWYRLIPVLSWLASRGTCHHCKVKISPRYPIIELTTAITTAYIVWYFGPTFIALAALVFSWILITICVIDFEHHLILDNLSLPLLWLGLIINTQSVFTSPTEAIWGAVLGYALLWMVFHSFKFFTGKEGMGYGDFKLLAALGAWFGIAAIAQIILIAALASIALGMVGIALKQRNMDTPMAFGPFLALGGWVTLFLGPTIL
ncbi:prepilin peptidase [Thiomicrorhabdus aquaedulcis]|uniref:prepilin peptidase n=1 Tax=Thiomicrorhabdus aquaedulcis TaxID=2211106 RepID=UPI000FD893FD|nr:A24 family peptidase [Thiomicrorhabdus aquaedulcis]